MSPRGVVKQVLDGGAVVIRGPPRNGPPAERILALTNIDAPRLGTGVTFCPNTFSVPYLGTISNRDPIL